jgi:nitroreductase
MDKPAETSVPVSDVIARRWSPRAYDEKAAVTEEQLRAILEAARWAASAGNTQPARYLVGRRGDETYKKILGTLDEGNQAWAHRASVLLIALTVTKNEKGQIYHAEYGLGLASQNLVLQAVHEGLIAHQMAGFSPEGVTEAFGLPDDVVPRVAIAVGKQAPADVLGDDRSVQRELAPRVRIPLSEYALSQWGTPAFKS